MDSAIVTVRSSLTVYPKDFPKKYMEQDLFMGQLPCHPANNIKNTQHVYN